MGQSQSSSRPTHPDSDSPATATTSTISTATTSAQTDPTTSANNARPRRSVRKSLLNLVKPSRRWSKAPSESSSPPTDTDNGPIASSSSSPLPIAAVEQEQDREVDGPESESTTSTDAVTGTGSATEASHESDAGATIASSSSSSDPSSLPVLEAVLSADATPNVIDNLDASLAPTAEPEPESEPGLEPLQGPAPPPQQQQQQQQQQQFPPPGTLVVVQGVVHTTDVPRPAASTSSSTSMPTAGLQVPSQSPLNRLSTLLSSSRPSSRASFPPSSATLDRDSTTPTNDPPPAPQQAIEPADDVHEPISSGSIDVLGTLLSVAAAATAASLLTGSTDPLTLPTSLSPPLPPTPASASAPPPVRTPTPIPPPTLLPTQMPPSNLLHTPSAVNGNQRPGTPTPRLRQAWGGIRSRLGLRRSDVLSPTPSPSTPFQPHPQSNSSSSSTHSESLSDSELDSEEDSSSEQDEQHSSASSAYTPTSAFEPSTNPSASQPATPTDPREHLFGQMARAFNLGLGLATDSTASSTAGSTTNGSGGVGIGIGGVHSTAAPTTNPPTPSQESEPPAEGTFERFLLDLQSDLRIALTSGTSTPLPAAAVPAPPVATAAEDLPPSHQDVPPPTYEPDYDSGAGNSEADMNYDSNANEEQNEDDDMPALADVSDSDSDAESFEDASSSSHAEAPAPALTPPLRPEVDAQGRINWWRLYRFAPITVPPNAQTGQGIPAALIPHPRPTSTPTSPSSTSTSVPSPSLHTPSASPSHQHPTDPTLAELPFASSSSSPLSSATSTVPQQPHTVVPVIVVGVQSVAPATASTFPVPPSDTDPSAPLTPTADDPAGTDTGGRERERGRGWHTRAAEAIRNLRPGHRRARAAAPSTAGSRTFLIYVIGGYYPPDHNILNGGPETLASLEALLELADLLGHAKPPTATKEEIEKSGLETIKSTQLEQYEREEKISSNCTERCLICLDDYQPEDDIRVMKCRHAFHQNCVDKWLETGRNNCPACRSKGVPVDSVSDL